MSPYRGIDLATMAHRITLELRENEEDLCWPGKNRPLLLLSSSVFVNSDAPKNYKAGAVSELAPLYPELASVMWQINPTGVLACNRPGSV